MRKFDKVYSFNGKELKVKAYKGVPCVKWGTNRFKHKILFTIGNKETSFYFYGSEMDYSTKNPFKNEVNDAVDCILSDAFAFLNTKDITDFIHEYGYDEVDGSRKEGETAYNGCKKTYGQLISLGLTTNDMEILSDLVWNN